MMLSIHTFPGRPQRLALCVLLSLSAACAHDPVPSSLEQAEVALAQPSITELNTLQPRLVREAREARAQARQAYDRGDIERAELYGHIARNKLMTASNLVSARGAEALTGRMDEAYAGLEVQAQSLGRLEQEVERADKLARDLDSIQQAQKDLNTEQKAAWDRARRAILAARTLQAKLLGERPALTADPRYAQGRALIESAVEATDQQLYDGAYAQANDASALFKAMLDSPRDEAAALAVAESSIAAAPPAAAAPAEKTSEDGSRGLAAMAAAQRARGEALARGVPVEAMVAPDALLREASVALDGRQDREAAALALAAARAYATLSAPAAPAPSAAVAALDADAPTSSRRRAQPARERLWAMQQLRADAIIDGADGRCADTFRSFDAMLELASSMIEAGEGERATEVLIRADERVRSCIVMAPAPAKADAAKPAPQAAQAVKSVNKEQREGALTSLQKAQSAWASRAADEPDSALVKQSAKLITEAQRWWQAEEYALSQSSSSAALTMLADKPQTAQTAKAAKADEVKAAQALKPADAAAKKPSKEEVARCEQATRRAEAATVELKKRGDVKDAAGERAQRLIKTSSRMIEGGLCEDAIGIADEALMVLAPQDKPAAGQERAGQERVGQERAAQPTVVVIQPNGQANDKADKGSDKRGEDPVQVRLGLEGQVSAQPAKADPVPVDDSWKLPYGQILDALVLRDRVAAQIGEPEQETFDRGRALLERSRVAWDGRDYLGAGKLALAATDEFQAASKQATKRKEDERSGAASAAERAKLDAEAAAQRKLDEAARAKAEQARAEAEAKQREAEAKQAANQAAQDKASEAARLAEIARVDCERARCDRRDAATADRARVNASAAKEAMGQGAFDRAAILYADAERAWRQAQTAPLPFTLGADLVAVRLVGERLVLTPRITFNSGTAILTPGSRPAMEQCVKALLANQGSYTQLRIVGFTDDRGDDAKNLALSQQRAEAVRRYMVESGIDESLLVAEGLGEAQPVATNKNAAGRDANRRVELLLTFPTSTQEKP
jgi:flagellar motor protein MotB